MVSWGELFSTFLVRKIMGVEGTCRSGNRGGCPLSYTHHIVGIPFCPLVFPFPAYHQGKKHQKQGKTGQKLYFIWCALVFSRENRRQQGAETYIYFTFGCRRASRCGSLFRAVVVSTGAGFRGTLAILLTSSK